MGPADFIAEVLIGFTIEIAREAYRDFRYRRSTGIAKREAEYARVEHKLAARPVPLRLGFAGRIQSSI